MVDTLVFLHVAETKFKFYRCFNAIYSQCKSELTCVNSLKSYCLPVVLYDCEATWSSKGTANNLDHLINQAVSKIFNTYDPNDVQFIHSMVELNAIQLTVKKRSICI